MSPRLCVDVSNTLETDSLSGIQRVTIELTNALTQARTIASDPQSDIVLLDGRSGRFLPLRPGQHKRLDRLRNGRSGRPLARRVDTRVARSAPYTARRSPFSIAADSVLLDVEASWHAPMARADLLPRLDAHTAALIHDILPITNPEWFPPASVARFRSWFEAHVAAESTLLAVSETSADAVAETGAPRPAVIRMGSPSTPPATSAPSSAGILMIGTIEPRKGHATILDALDLLGDRAPVIDVVGRPGWDTDDLVDRLEQHPHVRWHRSLDDDDLETLWSLTGLLLQPSLGEGFGLPVAEALQRSVAVASSDIPVMQEVGRGETTLVTNDPRSWADTIASFANDPTALPRPGRIAWPTWHDSAADTLDALTAAGLWPDGGSVSQ